MEPTTLSKKIYRETNLSAISKLLLRIYPDFENNYLPTNKKNVLELLSLHELKMFMGTEELQEKIQLHKLFREYVIVLFVNSIKEMSASRSEIIDDLFEYLHIVKNTEIEELIESVSNYFYSK